MIKIRGKFSKENDMKFIGHLDLMRLFQRAFRRADIPVKYSEGYNPQPKISLATALPLGVVSQGEYFDLELEEEMPLELFISKMNEALPKSLKLLKAQYTDDKKSIMSLISWSSYVVRIEFSKTFSEEQIHNEIEDFLDRKEILVTKVKKKKGKTKKTEVNIREFIKELNIFDINNDHAILKILLKTGSNGNLKPEDLISALIEYSDLEIKVEKTKIQRLELFIEENNEIVTPI